MAVRPSLDRPVTVASLLRFSTNRAVFVRLLELLLELLALSLAASTSSNGQAWFGFLMFVAISSLVLSIVFISFYALSEDALPRMCVGNTTLPALEMVLTFTFTILWFAAGIGIGTNVSTLPSPDSNLKKGQATAAFAILSAAVWCFSAAFSFQRFRDAPSITETTTSNPYQRAPEEYRESSAAAAQKRSQENATRGVPNRNYGTDAV